MPSLEVNEVALVVEDPRRGPLGPESPERLDAVVTVQDHQCAAGDPDRFGEHLRPPDVGHELEEVLLLDLLMGPKLGEREERELGRGGHRAPVPLVLTTAAERRPALCSVGTAGGGTRDGPEGPPGGWSRPGASTAVGPAPASWPCDGPVRGYRSRGTTSSFRNTTET